MIAVSTHNGRNATIDEVRAVPYVAPKNAGRNYQGVRHGELIDTMLDVAKSRGWDMTNGQFALSKDGVTGLAGAFDIAIPDVPAPEGQALGIGVLTANDRRRRLKIVVGTRVFCCNNGACTGEVVLNMLHTKGNALFDAVDTAFDNYVIAAKATVGSIAAMRETEVSPDRANAILMEAGRKELMPWSRIGAVDAEFRKPTFAEHGRGTAWSLFNAFTLVVKACPVMTQMEQTNGFRELLMTTAA